MRYDPGHVRRYFDEYGSREWDRLASSLESQVNFHMHQKFLLEYVHRGDRVLEVGPGPGRFTCELAALGAEIVAFDISSEQLRLNQERMEHEGMGEAVEAWIQGDVTDLSRFDDGEFDAVVAYGGPLSYVCDQADQALGEMLRVTRPGGYVLLSVMSHAGTTRRFLPGIVEMAFQHGLEKVDEVTRTGNLRGAVSGGHHCRMYCWSELQALLEGHDCDIVAASASNFLAVQNEETLRLAHSRPWLWETFLQWEEMLCQEAGALDGGTHIIAVVCKHD
ncbi:MAG: class I SAM-dependent methyltransferase [Limnochordia bacterium]|jgi:ubiquinone/menaquinone biosynthesis C-methylase UbiE